MLTVYLSTRLSLFRSPLTIFRTACRKFHSTYPPLLLSVFIGKAKVTTLVLLNCCCYWYPGSFSSLALSQSMVLVFLPCLKFFCRLSQPPQSISLSKFSSSASLTCSVPRVLFVYIEHHTIRCITRQLVTTMWMILGCTFLLTSYLAIRLCSYRSLPLTRCRLGCRPTIQ